MTTFPLDLARCILAFTGEVNCAVLVAKHVSIASWTPELVGAWLRAHVCNSDKHQRIIQALGLVTAKLAPDAALQRLRSAAASCAWLRDGLSNQSIKDRWLERAATKGHLHLCDVLLRVGASHMCRYEDEDDGEVCWVSQPDSALVQAASAGHVDVCALLMEHHARTAGLEEGSLVDAGGALYEAATPQVLACLLEHGADAVLGDQLSGDLPPMIQAAADGRVDLLDVYQAAEWVDDFVGRDIMFTVLHDMLWDQFRDRVAKQAAVIAWVRRVCPDASLDEDNVDELYWSGEGIVARLRELMTEDADAIGKHEGVMEFLSGVAARLAGYDEDDAADDDDEDDV